MDTILTIVKLLGGLGLFIYGMKLMGDGLENAAGEGLKKILEKVTKNPLIGVIVGAVVTMVIQSSSATTVMVVGFVNAGLMNLAQAAWIIMGANVGTTVTAQLVAFKLDDIAPIFVFVGAMMVMFVKGKRRREIGSIILGFGILFNIKGKNLILAGIGGAIGGMVYKLVLFLGGSEMIAMFSGSVVFSLYSEILARVCKTTVTTFIICALIPLVPGGGMYRTMQQAIAGNIDKALAIGLNTISIAGVLVLGILLVSTLMRAFYHMQKERKARVWKK